MGLNKREEELVRFTDYYGALSKGAVGAEEGYTYL